MYKKRAEMARKGISTNKSKIKYVLSCDIGRVFKRLVPIYLKK